MIELRRMRRILSVSLCMGALTSSTISGDAHPGPSPTLRAQTVQLPGGEAGIGFDDLQYAPSLKKILVPGGRTGKLFLLDPSTRKIAAVAGFSSKQGYSGGHGDGTTSACEDGKIVYASDRGSGSIKIVDAAAGKILASVRLSGSPDYVRCLPDSRELWVTEPGKEQIEVLALEDAGRAAKSIGLVRVPGGPESLAIDMKRMRAYTHTWKGTTFAIDLKAKAISEKWSNGCEGARGIALDEEKGFLFVGCEEGTIVVLGVTDGKELSTQKVGAGIDSIRYAPPLGHLYAPGAESADVSILAVSPEGHLSLLGKTKTGPGAHTAAFDPDTRTVSIGLPEHGRVLIIHDSYASESHQ